MLHGFARVAFFAARTAKPLSDYRIGNLELGIGKLSRISQAFFSNVVD
jgi:hypothetical protein